MPLIREVLETMQVPQLCVEGVEADDVIATLATQGAAEGLDVIVVTGDRDAFQLIEDPHIKVLYNRRGVSDYVLYDEAGIAERYLGVTARQYPQYAALRGDNSDNLPGVPGIGEKTAAALIVKYGDLDAVFEHLDELPPKQRQNLGEHKERVLLNRTMTYLRRDLELEFAPSRPAPGRLGPARPCGPCSTSWSSGRCSPGCRWRWGRRRPRPETDSPRVRGRRTSATSDEAAASWPACGRPGERLRAGTALLGPPWAAATCSAWRWRATTQRHLPPGPCPGGAGGGRRPRRPGGAGRPAARRPPGQGADARPAPAARGQRKWAAARSTSAPSISTPSSPPICSTRPRASYELPELARRYLSLDVAAGTAAAEGHARPRRATPASRRRAGGRRPSTAWPSPSRRAWRPGS